MYTVHFEILELYNPLQSTLQLQLYIKKIQYKLI